MAAAGAAGTGSCGYGRVEGADHGRAVAERETVIRDLFGAEERCCAFLAFSCTRTGEGLLVEVSAPAEAGPTLDGLQALAERSAPPQVVARGWGR